MKQILLVSLCLLLAAACAPSLPPTEIAPLGPTATARPTNTPLPPPTATPSPTPFGMVDIPNATVTYYDIVGSTVAELRAQLNEKGPVGYDNYKGDATVNWYISWSWPGYGSATCDLSAAVVLYDIQVVMPRWTPPNDAPPELVTKWTDYVTVLAKHEQGHVDNVMNHAPILSDAIKTASCETAEAAAQAVLTRIRQADVDYDAATNHGASQGARFP